jgi:hypothetical protein
MDKNSLRLLIYKMFTLCVQKQKKSMNFIYYIKDVYLYFNISMQTHGFFFILPFPHSLLFLSCYEMLEWSGINSVRSIHKIHCVLLALPPLRLLNIKCRQPDVQRQNVTVVEIYVLFALSLSLSLSLSHTS